MSGLVTANADTNVWRGYAQTHGFDVYPDDGDDYIYVAGERQPQHETDRFYNAMERYFERAWEYLQVHDDAPMSRFLDPQDPWSATIEAFIANDWYIREAAHVSTRAALEEGEDYDWFCKQGLGTLIAHYGRNIPVHTGVPVTRIDWRGDGVKVESAAGALHCRSSLE